MRKQSLLVILTILITLAALNTALAHDWYINAVDYVLPKPGTATIFMCWGHGLPLDDPIGKPWMSKVEVMDPAGKSSVLDLPEEKSYHFTEIDCNQPGTYTIYGESAPEAYYCMYLDKAGKMHHVGKALDEIDDAAKVIFGARLFYAPKTCITVGEISDDAPAPEPVGQKLEIVPLQAPGTIHSGDRFRFRVLLDGKPVPDGARFDATYLGYSMQPDDYVFMGRAVRDGIGEVDIPCAGVWYIRAHYYEDAPAEMKSKCGKYMYLATLTFLVGKKPPGRAMPPH